MAVRLLDNVIDMSDFPVEKINKVFRNNRRVGLGIMGFADMLYQLKVPYDSDQGFAAGKRVMHLVNTTAHEYSEQIAKEKGTFPNWEISIFGPKGQNKKQRNAALTTVAPTGSISMLLDCSSGVEPFFALSYQKEVMSGQKLTYINSILEDELKNLGLYSEDIIKEIERTGSVQHITEIPENIRKVYVTAMDISAEAHIKMQAAFQSEVDNSISKTINFPYSATREDVRQGYLLAWKSGLKGCTVYRDGSRKEQVLTIAKDAKKEEAKDTSCEVCESTENVELKQNFEEVIPPPVGNSDTHTSAEHDPRMHMSLSKNEIIKSRKCPECSNPIQIAEGCMLCLSCGFSACSA